MKKLFLLSAITMLAIGCATSDIAKWYRPSWSQVSERDEPLNADTKVARLEQIKGLAERASEMSPAEQMTTSTKLAEQVRTESDSLMQLEIVRALGSFNTPGSIEGLRQALLNERPNVRIAACDALTEINSSQALEVLSDVAHSDSNLDVRAAAVRGLGKFRDEQALRALAVAINDRDPAIQYLAVKSMQKVHGENLGESLSAWKELARNLLRTPDKNPQPQVELAELPSSEMER